VFKKIIELGDVAIKSHHMLVKVRKGRSNVRHSRPGIDGDLGYHYFQEYRSILDSLLVSTLLDDNCGLHATVFHLECTVVRYRISDAC